MPKKKHLDIEYTYDFQLYGIISTIKPYKLAWEISRLMAKKITKLPDFEIINKAKFKGLHIHYAMGNEVNGLRFFKNKPNEESESREFLVPEYPHFDFIVLTQGELFNTSNRLQELLRDIPSIQLVAFIPLSTLKAKEHFIF